MLRAILFDLDNTLILFDEMELLRHYLPAVAQEFTDIMPVDFFRERILSSSKALLQNNGEMSNADYFMDLFCKGYENKRDELWNRFIRFYSTRFDEFQVLTEKVEGVRDIMMKLRSMNLKLVIASNPFWPRVCQLKRLAWAGLEEVDFDLVTDIENTTFCKPNIGYYHEICRNIDVQPDECMMVGNDPVNDMVAGKIEMKTYLTMDSDAHTGSGLIMSRRLANADADHEIHEPDFRGLLSDVVRIVEGLMRSGEK
jgi:HAD superfamily hydrolase (TIGR01549 family)